MREIDSRFEQKPTARSQITTTNLTKMDDDGEIAIERQ